MTKPLLEVRHVRKAFPGVLALDDVSLTVFPAEVLALVGENGAGKSTLMKILAGVYTIDSGEILADGRRVEFRDVKDALAAGVSLIHQELNLAENLSVTANLFLGREKTYRNIWLDNAGMRAEAAGLLRRVGLDASLADVRVETLAPGQKQLVEIARALSVRARVIIMDEPTSSLTQRETDQLYRVIDELKAAGVTVIYISHRLAEVKRCADRVEVLRDGKNAGTLGKAEISHNNIVKMMVGRDLKQIHPRSPRSRGKAVLEVRGLRYEGGPAEPVSFNLYAGEIAGMAGLVGAGRTELAEALFGLRPIVAGDVLLDGRPFLPRHPRDAVEAGLLLVPEDRRANGLVLAFGAGFNISLPNLAAVSKVGYVNRAAEHRMATEQVDRLRVKTPGLRQPVGFLSGGNQQKVVLGKWLARPHKVLVLDEPTRGVDVGAREEIYRIVDRLAGEGVAVWMISSDMEEILGMSDRLLVLHEGKLAGELPRSAFSEEAVMRLATGISE